MIDTLSLVVAVLFALLGCATILIALGGRSSARDLKKRTRPASGLLLAADRHRLTVAVEEGAREEFLLAPDAELTLDGAPAAPDALAAGSRVTLFYEQEGESRRARRIAALSPQRPDREIPSVLGPRRP